MAKNKNFTLDKDTLIGDILKNFPEAARLLVENGLFCVNCPLAQFETLEQGAKTHGMSDKKIEEMIKDINKHLNKKVLQRKSGLKK